MNHSLHLSRDMQKDFHELNIINFVEKNKININNKQQTNSTAWRQINLKQNNHLKKQKFMALAHSQHKNIDKSLEMIGKP